jgi:hypothetical protein
MIWPASEMPPGFFLESPSTKKNEPASVFDDSGIDLPNLLSRLNKRFHRLSLKEKLWEAANEFMEWFRQERSRIVGIVFHCGEVITEELEPLNMHIISTNNYSYDLIRSIPGSVALIFWPTFSDLYKMEKTCSVSDASKWRAFFSSELIVVGGSRSSIGRVCELIEQVKDRFEEDTIPDIADLVALDVRASLLRDPVVSKDVLYVHDEGATKGLTKEGFERIAKSAMKKRRVANEIRGKVLPEVKKAVAR